MSKHKEEVEFGLCVCVCEIVVYLCGCDAI